MNSAATIQDKRRIDANVPSQIDDPAVVPRKTILVPQDLMLIEDSEDGFAKKTTTAQALNAAYQQEDDSWAISQDDYTLTDIVNTTVLRVDITANNLDLTGIVPPSPVFSKELLILNVGEMANFRLRLMHESGASAAENRFICPQGNMYTLENRGGALVVYDITSQRWRVIAAG